MKKLSLILSLLFTFIHCYANTPHLYALHINGVNTTRTEAQQNSDALKSTAQVDSNMVIFNYIWNPTGPDAAQNIVSNISDVITQKAQENQSIMSINDFTDYYIAHHATEFPPSIYHRGTPEYTTLQISLYKEYHESLKAIAGQNFDTIINEFHDEVPPPFKSVVELLNANPNTHKDRNNYPKTVNLKQMQGFKNIQNLNDQPITIDYSNTLDYILLLPHSQGNLYANSLYEYLIKNEKLSKNHIAIYGIATPATSNKGSWLAKTLSLSGAFGNVDSYITSSNDYVIATANYMVSTLKKFAPSIFQEILPANFTIPFVHSYDWGDGHSLIKVYLADRAAKLQIEKMIHLELFLFTQLIADDLKSNNFLLAIGNQKQGGGLIGPTGVICLDGACDSRLLYFTENTFETVVLDNIGDSIQSFVPKEFLEGEYLTIEPLIYGHRSIYAGNNAGVLGYISYVDCTPDDICRGSSYQDRGTMFSMGVNPTYFNLFSPDYFWNGRFIAERAYVN